MIARVLGVQYLDYVSRKTGNPVKGLYSGSVVKTKIQAFYNEPISVAELGRCPR